MASESVTVYLKGDRNVEVTKQDVTLGDILEIECQISCCSPKSGF